MLLSLFSVTVEADTCNKFMVSCFFLHWWESMYPYAKLKQEALGPHRLPERTHHLPNLPPGPWFKQSWIYTIWGGSTQIWAFLAKQFLRKRISSYVKIRPPILVSLYPRGPWLKQIWIFTIWGCFHTRYRFSGQMVLQIIFKDFSSYIPIWKIRSTPQLYQLSS